jgi:hypothetical protein
MHRSRLHVCQHPRRYLLLVKTSPLYVLRERPLPVRLKATLAISVMPKHPVPLLLRLLLLLPARRDRQAPPNMLHVKLCQRPW